MNRLVTLMIICGFMVSCTSVPQPKIVPVNVSSRTDFRTMPPDQVLATLRNASSIRIESPRGSQTDPLWLPICDGKRGDKVLSHAREDACQSSFIFASFYETMTSDPSVLLYSMEALFRGCGLYAPSLDQSHGGLTCGKLGLLFHLIGNDSAARAIWEQAPGCYSLDDGDSLVNGCMSFIVGGYVQSGNGQSQFILDRQWAAPSSIRGSLSNSEAAYKDNPVRLAQMARVACNQVHDRSSCQYLAAHGEPVNMAAVEMTERSNRQARKEAAAENNAEIDRRNRESHNRRDSILSMLQSMPGASDPNAILNAGNQQAAAIRAIGDANAARQQQNTQLHLASQRTPLQPTGQVTSSTTGPAITSQSSAQVLPPSTGATSNVTGSNSAIQYSTPLAASCVRQFWDPNTYNWLSFENDCGQAIYVAYIPHRPGGWAIGGGMHLAPGDHNNIGLSKAEVNQTAGFDLYVCPTDSVPVDLSGNTFTVNVAQYRCKAQ